MVPRERHRGQGWFLAGDDPRAFDPVAVTVDVVALTIKTVRCRCC